MSYFTEEARKLMAENNVGQIEISQKTDLIPSQVSHILHEKQKTVEPHTVPKFAKVIARDKVQQAQLLRAYLMDHIPQNFPAAELIDIIVKQGRKSDVLREQAPGYRAVRLAPDVEEAIDSIRARIPNDSNMRDLILRLAKFA